MKTKLLGTLMIVFGVFLFVGVVSASDADVLQPASDVVYNETLVVNGTGVFDSIRVGKQGVGGVTFFNGTIVNETTDGGNPIPVTFGDDVRIDGLLWRGAVSGPGDSMPIQLDDDVTVYGKLTVDDEININASIIQNDVSEGLVKGWAFVNSLGELLRGYNVESTSRESTGKYDVKFNFNVSTRAHMAVPSGTSSDTSAIRLIGVTTKAGDDSVVRVHSRNTSGTFANSVFMITVY